MALHCHFVLSSLQVDGTPQDAPPKHSCDPLPMGEGGGAVPTHTQVKCERKEHQLSHHKSRAIPLPHKSPSSLHATHAKYVVKTPLVQHRIQV